MSPNSGDTDLLKLCGRYYGPRDGYFNGSEISGLQITLPRINEIFQNDHDLNPCMDLTLNYLCHYYFPLCNLTTGEITPVCSGSCAILLNNEDCYQLRTIANEELENDSVISTGDSCLQTYHSYATVPVVSEICLSIEG